MSHFTHRIRHMINNDFPFNLNDYPIFDENYREVLNKKILDYYYLDEIEHETAEIFNIRLGITMDLIMPKYNEMYKMQKRLLDELSLDYVETFTSTTKSTSDSKVDASGSSKTDDSSNSESRYSDTPMNNFNNLDNYLTQATRNNDKSNTSSSNTSNNKSESKSDGVTEYERRNKDSARAFDIYNSLVSGFKNIDMLIIKDLEKLFFKMY